MNMSSKRYDRRAVLALVCWSLLGASCTDSSRLRYTLEQAGENRAELEKVLEHYRDSGQKYEAARFLIEQMAGHGGYREEGIRSYAGLYDAYEAINQECGHRQTEEWGRRIDSLYEHGAHRYGTPDFRWDAKKLSAAYLIREIDRSFEAWRQNVWSRDCPWEVFCEYVLPYRRQNGLVADGARDTFFLRHAGRWYAGGGRSWMEETDSLLYEYRHLTHNQFHGAGMPIWDVATFERLRHGLCQHRCWFNVQLISSLGMPVAVDFVPAWGNRNSSHTWNVLMVGGDSQAFEPFWDEDRWKYKRIYNNRSVDRLWGKFRLPKVFRYTYSRHPEGPVTDKEVCPEDIPALFRNVWKKDVSSEYFEGQDVTVRLSGQVPEGARYAYLAVFGHQQWHPVQWGRIDRDGTVTFRGMGRDIVYLPVCCSGGRTVPVAAPFQLLPDGSVRTLEVDGQRGQVSLRIVCGAPASDDNRQNFAAGQGLAWYALRNGRVAEELCRQDCPLELGYSELPVHTASPCRYVRMYLPGDTLALGDVEFRTVGQRIDGVMALTDLRPFRAEECVSWLADGEAATAVRGKVSRRYVDFDLGRDCRIEIVRLYPYLESEVTEGRFELLYWEDGWKSAGCLPASPCGYLTFKGVPTHALLMLKNRSKGWEGRSSERIFICRNHEVDWE